MSATATPGNATAEAGTAVLEAIGVKKSFGRVRALRDASLTLRSGTVTALVGDNGAGKSTLVRILTGVMQPDEGEIKISGESVHLPDSRHAAALGIHTVFPGSGAGRHADRDRQHVPLRRGPSPHARHEDAMA